LDLPANIALEGQSFGSDTSFLAGKQQQVSYSRLATQKDCESSGGSDKVLWKRLEAQSPEGTD
jgi:hypothetical protein